MPALSQVAVNVHSQRAPAMKDRRWEKSFAALFNSLLQSLLNLILICWSQSAYALRQVTKTTDGGFDLAGAFKVRQLVEAGGKVPSQFQMTLNGFRVAALAHKLERHPKLQSVEASGPHLAIAKEVVLRIGKSAVLAEILRGNVERITQNVAAIAHQRRSAGKRNEHPFVGIEGDRVCQLK